MASHSHETLTFNKISLDLDRHEPCTTATNQHMSLRVGSYRDMTSSATQIVLLQWGAAVGYCMYVNVFDVSLYWVDIILRRYSRYWSRFLLEDFSLRREYSMHTAINN